MRINEDFNILYKRSNRTHIQEFYLLEIFVEIWHAFSYNLTNKLNRCGQVEHKAIYTLNDVKMITPDKSHWLNAP